MNPVPPGAGALVQLRSSANLYVVEEGGERQPFSRLPPGEVVVMLGDVVTSDSVNFTKALTSMGIGWFYWETDDLVVSQLNPESEPKGGDER